MFSGIDGVFLPDATELALEDARERARTVAMSTACTLAGCEPPMLTGDSRPDGMLTHGTEASCCVRFVHLPDSLRGHDGSYDDARTFARGIAPASLIQLAGR